MPTTAVAFRHSCVVQVLAPKWNGSERVQFMRSDSVTGIVRPHMRFGFVKASDVLCDDGRILKDVYRCLYTVEDPEDASGGEPRCSIDYGAAVASKGTVSTNHGPVCKRPFLTPTEPGDVTVRCPKCAPHLAVG